jgi:hypothetical protein
MFDTENETASIPMRDRCGNEPWPCYRADCSNPECMTHRKHHPDCGGYACYCAMDGKNGS